MYTTEEVKIWCKEIDKFCEFAETQPHAAYAAFYHREVWSKQIYIFSRKYSRYERLFFKPLDDLIGNIFFLTLLQTIFTDQDRQLYSLPVKVAV